MSNTIPKYGPQMTALPASVPSLRGWWGSALGLFFIASLFGCSMRYMFVGVLPGFEYKHLLHAHSHVALMGWAFLLVSGGLVAVFGTSGKRYGVVLWLNLMACAGMSVSFAIQGYGAISIAFSALHLASALVFAGLMHSDLRSEQNDLSVRFARWSIVWMLVSFAGLMAIGPVSAQLGKLHPVYFMCIQWFLHFQLNGWLTFGVFAILLRHSGLGREMKRGMHRGFWLLQIALLLTYTLSVTWSTPIAALFFVNSLGVVLQALAFGLLLWPVAQVLHVSARVNDPKHWLLLAGLLSLGLKVAIQSAVALPLVATISYTIKNYVIGFIHLIVLGSVTFSVAGVLLVKGLLPYTGADRVGWVLLMAAFALTELLLMGQGTLFWLEVGFIPNYHLILFITSILFPVAIGMILTGVLRQGNITEKLNTL